ncbi:MAG: ABC transporter ATP-binding protein [Chloroflexi bacterium]|nr:ABC transporter ATP-binding protein [Chloroflexota bacterium]
MIADRAVRVQGLRKEYGSFAALKGIDLEIAHGEVFALLGPNGAGKTTFVEILEGYRRRTGGAATVLGNDPGESRRDWRARIGIVLQASTVFDLLTVNEVVAHFAGFYPAPLDVGDVIGLVGLDEKRTVRCDKLSGGQKRRVDLALGLIGDPDLIFLDEPTTGLDPEGRHQLWDVVRAFTALGKTVVLTTHYIEEAEVLADRVGVIIAGELAAVGTPRELGGRKTALATVRFEAPGALAAAPPPAVPGEWARRDGTVSIATAAPTETVRLLTEWARTRGFDELPAITITRPSLEDIYLEMVESAGAVTEGRADQ